MKSRLRTVLGAGLIPMEWLAALLLFLMMGVTFVDVVGRYAFNAPLYGAAEIIQFLLAGVIFAGLSLVSADDAHIGVELLADSFHNRMPRLQPLLVGAVSVIGLVAVAVQLGQSGLESLHTDRRTVVLEWPYAAIAIPGTLLCLYAALVQSQATWGRLRGPSSSQGPEGGSAAE